MSSFNYGTRSRSGKILSKKTGQENPTGPISEAMTQPQWIPEMPWGIEGGIKEAKLLSEPVKTEAYPVDGIHSAPLFYPEQGLAPLALKQKEQCYECKFSDRGYPFIHAQKIKF